MLGHSTSPKGSGHPTTKKPLTGFFASVPLFTSELPMRKTPLRKKKVEAENEACVLRTVFHTQTLLKRLLLVNSFCKK